MSHPLPHFSLLEARVLGVLIEKQRTVPDSYPLTLNALVSGCNQKTSRDPVIEASDAEVQIAIDTLKRYTLIIESSGGRASRFAHNTERVLQIPSQSVALMATLMLRGPQTVGELRIACERLHKFADTSAVEGFLNELAERPAGGLVVELPRQPGARENRWAHLLSGPVEFEALISSGNGGSAGADISSSELAAIKANMARLETEVSVMKATISKLCEALGVDPISLQ